MNVVYRCICDRIIPEKRKLCSVCHKEYGSRETWPRWLIYLVLQNRRAYRAALRDSSVLLYLDDFIDSSLSGDGGHSDALVTRDDKDLFFDGNISLPYAPYELSDDNKRYRLANSIPDRT